MTTLSGFRVRVDASQLCTDLRKKSFIYVDLLHDRTIKDIEDHIKSALCIRDAIWLMSGDTGDYYLPSSENIRVLNEDDELKVLGTGNQFHAEENCEFIIPDEDVYELYKKRKKKKRKTDAENDIFPEEIDKSIQVNLRNKENITNIMEQNSNDFLSSSSNESLFESKKKKKNKDNRKSCGSKPNEVELFRKVEYSNSNLSDNMVESLNTFKNTDNSKNDYISYKKSEISQRKVSRNKDDSIEILGKISTDKIKPEDTDNFSEVNQDNYVLHYNGKERDEENDAGTENTTVNNTSNSNESILETDKSIKASFDCPISKCPKKRRVRTRKRKNRQYVDSVSICLSSPITEKKKQNNYFLSTFPTETSNHIRFTDDSDDDVNNAKESSITEENTELSIENMDLNHVTSVISNGIDDLANAIVQNNMSNQKIENNVESEMEISQIEKKKVLYYWNSANCSSKNISYCNKDTFSKLLSLEKFPTPVVFERKKNSVTNEQNKSLSVNSSKKNTEVNKMVETENIKPYQNNSKESKPAKAHNGKELDYLQYPVIETIPKKGDVIAFKMLKMSEDYTPIVSDYITAKVQNLCEVSYQISLKILDGIEHCQQPKGKFDLTEDANDQMDEIQINWNELYEARTILP